MTCFKIPASVCDDLEKECANFWWGLNNGKRKLHWRTWDFLSQPKIRGGLGFRRMSEFNRALLSKQVWRLIQTPNSLVCKVLKGQYFKHQDIMNAKLGTNPSYIRRSLLWSIEILDQGLLWRVGNGKTINILSNQWIPRIKSKIEHSPSVRNNEPKICSLLKNGAWDEKIINSTFNSLIAKEILRIPLMDTNT